MSEKVDRQLTPEQLQAIQAAGVQMKDGSFTIFGNPITQAQAIRIARFHSAHRGRPLIMVDLQELGIL